MGEQLETRYAQIIAAVVCNQRSIVEQRRGGDPGVGRLDPASGGLRGDHHLGPLAAKVGAGWHDGESLDIEAQPMDALGTPAVLKRPPLDFGHGHERDASSTPGQIRAIELSDGMVLEEERNYVSVDNDLGHAAGSVRLWHAIRGGSPRIPRWTPPRARNRRVTRRRR